MSSRSKQILFFLGLGFLVYLLRQTGWNALADGFRRLGWFLALILVFSGFKYVLSALAWSAAFFPEERQSWRQLFGYRVAGEAMNYLSFAGPFLGEPVKASMLRGVRFLPGLASTLLESTVNTIAATLVSVAGLALLLRSLPGGAARVTGDATILLLLGLTVGFLYVLRNRMRFLTGSWRALRRIPKLSSPQLGEKLRLIEERMHRLSFERPAAFSWMFLLSFAAQGLALLEIYVVLASLGITPNLSTILVIEAFTKLAKAVFFFVPTRIGADEGSSAGIVALLGFSPAAGIMLALARRVRALFWSAVGLGFLLAHSQGFGSRRPEVQARLRTEPS